MNKEKGFSLIELLIALAVISIISIAAFMFYNKVERYYLIEKFTKDISYSVSEYKHYMNNYRLDSFSGGGDQAYSQIEPAINSTFELLENQSSRYASMKKYNAGKGFFVDLNGYFSPPEMIRYRDGLYSEYLISRNKNFKQNEDSNTSLDEDFCAQIVMNNISKASFVDVIGGKNGYKTFSKTGDFDHRNESEKINVKGLSSACEEAKAIKFRFYASD